MHVAVLALAAHSSPGLCCPFLASLQVEEGDEEGSGAEEVEEEEEEEEDAVIRSLSRGLSLMSRLSELHRAESGAAKLPPKLEELSRR